MGPEYFNGLRLFYARGASFVRLRGKIPVDRGWQSRPRETLDEALAMAADGNIGIRTGAASGGLIVFDVEAKAEPGAYDALGLPQTMTVRTGRDGRHYYFRWPHQSNGRVIKNTTSKLAPFIDTRGWGGQVVFPGSVHPETGQLYEFMDDPAVTEIALLPEDFVDRHAAILLKDYKKPRSPAAPSSTPRPPAPGASRYAAAALDGECRRVAEAPEGTRNDTLNRAAFSLGQLVGAGALDESTVRDALISSARQCGLPDGEAEAAIRSGLGAGMAQPRTLPEPRQRPAPPPPDAINDDEWAPSDEDAPPDLDADWVADCTPFEAKNGEAARTGDSSDDGNPLPYEPGIVIDEFMNEHRRILLYHDTFYRYTGVCYRSCTDREMQARLVEFITGPRNNRKLWVVLRRQERHIESISPKPAFLKQALVRLDGDSRISYEPNLPHWISTGLPATNHVVLANGILNLDTYELLPHSSDCFTLAALPFAHDAAATCPRFIRFLNEIMQDDEEKLCSLQELFGYCLQSSQDGQKIFVLVGEGRNGKTVLINVLKMLIGPANCSAVPLESLHQPHATAALVGKMVNFSMEWKYLDPQAEGTLKAISGGDPVGVNPKNKPIFSTQLAAKIVIVSNEPPHITDRTQGMWRRIQIVPFKYVVPEDRTVPMEALLARFRAELPGILNWAIEGLRSWRERGTFTTTKDMVVAVEEYRRNSCSVGLWADESLEAAPGLSVPTAAIYKDYRDWADANGHKPYNSANFGIELTSWFRRKSGGQTLIKRRAQVDGRRTHYYEGITLPALPPGLD